MTQSPFVSEINFKYCTQFYSRKLFWGEAIVYSKMYFVVAEIIEAFQTDVHCRQNRWNFTAATSGDLNIDLI